MPNIPNIKPEINIDKDEVVNLLLASIGLEELGLAHIINAEGEKMQKALKALDSNDFCGMDKDVVNDLLKLNDSVNKTLREITKKEILLQYKFENVLEFCKSNCGKKKDCYNE